MDDGQPIECSGDTRRNTMENKRWYLAEEEQRYENLIVGLDLVI
jgi:hypothetical protein